MAGAKNDGNGRSGKGRKDASGPDYFVTFGVFENKRIVKMRVFDKTRRMTMEQWIPLFAWEMMQSVYQFSLRVMGR